MKNNFNSGDLILFIVAIVITSLFNFSAYEGFTFVTIIFIFTEIAEIRLLFVRRFNEQDERNKRSDSRYS